MRKPKQAQTNELIFRLDDENIEQALVDFIGRELRFLHDHLKQPYAEIAEGCGISAPTVKKFSLSMGKHPQVRTAFAILAYLDLEFDPERRAIVRRSNVVHLRK